MTGSETEILFKLLLLPVGVRYMNDLNDISLSGIRRINVIGTSGCGKSTFSARLANILQLPYVQIDQVYWKPQWTEPTDEEFFPKLAKAVDGNQWVLDGNYHRTRHIKWKNVQLIIWLDYSFSLTLFRAFKRAMKRAITGQELWEGTGNKESIKRSLFSKESIILWTIKTHGTNRERYNRIIQDKQYAHIKFLKLSNPKDARQFLYRMERLGR